MNICHSGGCYGADVQFGELAKQHGHTVRHYSFANHKYYGDREDEIILSESELSMANPYLKIAAKYLGRSFPSRYAYTNKLLQRNYYQVNNTHKIYAVTPLAENGIPVGGTGWAIAMAMYLQVPDIYVFDHNRSLWFKWDYQPEGLIGGWIIPMTIPFPEGSYTGIGSRDMSEAGTSAIRNLYR